MKLLIVLSLLTSCAEMGLDLMGKSNSSPDGFKITQVDNPKANYSTGGGKVKIQYKTYEELVSSVEKEGENEFKTKGQIKRRINLLPKGGKIIISIYRSTVSSANTKYFSYLIKKEGEVILRRNGSSSVPSTPSRYGVDGYFWTNIDVVNIPVAINNKITLFVIDKLNNGRDKFTLKKIKTIEI